MLGSIIIYFAFYFTIIFCRFLSLLARFDRSVRLYGVSLRLCDPVIGIFFDPSRRLLELRSLDYLHMALRCCTDPRATPPHTPPSPTYINILESKDRLGPSFNLVFLPHCIERGCYNVSMHATKAFSMLIATSNILSLWKLSATENSPTQPVILLSSCLLPDMLGPSLLLLRQISPTGEANTANRKGDGLCSARTSPADKRDQRVWRI